MLGSFLLDLKSHSISLWCLDLEIPPPCKTAYSQLQYFSSNYLSSLVLMTWVAQIMSFWLRFLSDLIPYQIFSDTRIYFLPFAHYQYFHSFTYFHVAIPVFFLSFPKTIPLLRCHACHTLSKHFNGSLVKFLW